MRTVATVAEHGEPIAIGGFRAGRNPIRGRGGSGRAVRRIDPGMISCEGPSTMRGRRCAGWLGLALAMTSPAGAQVVLYDAAAGTLPSAQGWVYLMDPLFAAQARPAVGGGAAFLDSTPEVSDKAGWFSNLPPFGRHPAQPSLHATPGFLVSFIARVREETHRSPDRAGFSVIVTTADLSAVELGFWTGEIWAQSGADFRRAESGLFDTTARRTRFDLEIRDGTYRLSADSQLVVEGPLRWYASFGAPYNIPEFLFFGDDTTSAAARIELVRVVAGSLPAIRVSRARDGLELATPVETGRLVVFEGSDDLRAWTEVGQSTGVEGVARWTMASDEGWRFFRAKLR